MSGGTHSGGPSTVSVKQETELWRDVLIREMCVKHFAENLMQILFHFWFTLSINALLISSVNYIYSETCEMRTPLGPAKKKKTNSKVSSFQKAVSTENSFLGIEEVSLFHRMSSFRRVAIHRFHCTCIQEKQKFQEYYFILGVHFLLVFFWYPQWMIYIQGKD
jgi:hypothetical protein